MEQGYHTPVLLEESVGLLSVDPAGTYVDLTFGGGGHSRRILSLLGPEGRLYGFDQDRDTLANPSRRPGAFITWRAISAFCALRCACGALRRSTAFWPIWVFRRIISTPSSGASRSAARRRSTCG